MSLIAPWPQEPERASVILPTVTCSSCSAPIALSDLSNHICRPPPRASASRSQPRPSQIAIPAPPQAGPSKPSAHHRGPSSFSSDPSPHPPYSSSSGRPSPANLAIPVDSTFSARSPQIRTPSPTNPFFPAAPQTPPRFVHGLGLNVGRQPEGPYPNDRPLPAGLDTLDMASGGGAGMAGVGRRAFAAAAWGVRAGVALASTAGQRPGEQSFSQAHAYQQPPPPPTAPPVAYQSQVAQQPGDLPPWQKQQPQTAPIPRDGALLPRVPLSGRQRSGTTSNGSRPPDTNQSSGVPLPSRSASAMGQVRPAPVSPPQRSSSAMDRPLVAIHQSPSRKGVFTSVSSSGSGGSNNISQLLKGQSGEKPQNNGKFFDKYKQMVSSSSSRDDSPAMRVGAARRGSDSDASRREELVASPVQTAFDLDDEYDDGQTSALPWATPALAASPVIGQETRKDVGLRPTHRYATAGSEASSSSSMSSGRSGRYGGTSGPESEEVVTPSQSWEGLAERANGNISRSMGGVEMRKAGSYDNGAENRDVLQDIGEEDEDEGDRVVFGGVTPPRARRTSDSMRHQESRMQNSSSSSTIKASAPPSASKDTHVRSYTAPEVLRSSSSATSSTRARTKTCQKCGEPVGGSKRFVERDGVVLCEKDWKKLYLPSCRRCNLPIEKSAVSSSDGQLKGKWHRACFTCTRCDRPFEGDSFYVLSGKPWCQHHYHEENGTLCASASCRQPIEGPCILTPHPNAQRFHPGHLRCDHRGGASNAQTCREAMDEYYDLDGKRYCDRHVGEAQRRTNAEGKEKNLRAEKRRTRLVDLPIGGF